MGSVLSGSSGWRGGKKALETVPVARFAYAELFQHGRRETYVRVDCDDWATIVHGGREWPVEIRTYRLHFGGVRRLLVCPCCGSRRQDLYIYLGQLACRACHGLVYGSQTEDRRSRLRRKAYKIRQRLGWIPDVFLPYGIQPVGLRDKTYLRLRDALDATTNALFGNYSDLVDRFEAMLDRRKG